MRKIIFIILGLSLLSGVKAQSGTPDDRDIIQSVFGKEKGELVKTYMELQGKADTVFWKIYDDYEAERRELVREKLAILDQYVDNYDILNDEMVDKLSKDSFSNMKKTDKLHEKYYNKIKKAVGALNASKFMQMEIYLQRIVEVTIMDEIPFIGELKGLKQ